MTLADRAPVTAEDRQARILALLDQVGRVEVSDLAERLAVSEETIRRDLRALEQQDRLLRAHGGAVARGMQGGATLSAHDRQFFQRLAQEIPTEGIVYLDGDGPLEHLIALWPESATCTIVTPLIDFAIAACRRPELDVVSLGGEVTTDGALRGDWTLRMLNLMHITTAIVLAESCSAAGELRCSLGDAPVRTRALARADRTVVALREQSSDPQHVFTFARSSEVDLLITTADTASALPVLDEAALVIVDTPDPTPARA